MNKNKITILALGCIGILIAVFGFANSIEAANPSIYVSPTSLSKKVGDVFDISVEINPAGEKVCMVEGKLVLDKLSCQSVSPNSDLMASPDNKLACSNLYFSLGIPTCTTENKILFTVTVKAKDAGTAIANFSGVDIIGEGVSVPSTFSGGTYTLTVSEEEVVPEREEEVTPEEEITPEGEEEEIVEEEEEEIVIGPEEEEIVKETSFLAAVGSIVTLGTDNVWIAIIVAIIVLAIIVYLAFYFTRKFRKKKLE
jgi:hypothetical protein